MFRSLHLRRLLTLATLIIPALAPLLALAQQGSTPILFEVRSPTNTVYLFGTVHIGKRALYPLSPVVEAAFASSRVLALEADPSDRTGVVDAMARSVYRAPDTLANHIAPALMQDLTAILPQIGLPLEYARTMKPHLLAMTAAMMEISRLGYDPSLGLDVHFARRAAEVGKPLTQLESMHEQVQMLESLSADAQEAMLRVTVEQIAQGTLETELDQLLAAWSAGDAPRIEEILDRETAGLDPLLAAEVRSAVYDRRNQAMAQKVAALLRGEVPHFVAVGAGHLLGANGLPELLRQQGFSVVRL